VSSVESGASVKLVWRTRIPALQLCVDRHKDCDLRDPMLTRRSPSEIQDYAAENESAAPQRAVLELAHPYHSAGKLDVEEVRSGTSPK
jgi:hypothetical protein